MANVKSIVDIEINDAAFQRFYDLFKQYESSLEDQPDAWNKIGDAMGAAGGTLNEKSVNAKEALALAAAQAGVIVEALHAATKAQEGLVKATTKSDKGFQGLAKSAQSVHKVVSMLAGGIVSLAAAAGLGAIFGGFGIGDLAGGAFNRYRSSGQLGVSPGQLGSFQTNAQMFLGLNDLQAAADAKNDISKAGYLAALGISYGQSQRTNAPDLAFEMLRRAADAYNRHPGMAMQMPAIMGYLALGGNIGNVRNAAANPASVNAAQLAYHRSISAMELHAKAMSDLKIKFDGLGMTIESALVNRLAPLAPQIAILADDIGKFIATFLKGPQFDAIVNDAKGALVGMTDFLRRVNWKQLGDDLTVVLGILGLMKPKGNLDLHPKSGTDALRDIGFGGTTTTAKQIEGWKFLFGSAASAVGGWIMDGAKQKFGWAATSYYAPTTGSGRPSNNPLDIRAKSGFRRYASTDLGIKDAASLLAWYPHGLGAHTLSEIIAKWAPPGDNNDTGAYINNVEKWSGVNRNIPIEKWTKAQFATVIAAMSRQEGTDQVSPQQVYRALYGANPATRQRQRHKAPVHVSVTNSTSARVAVSINGAAHV